MKKQFIFFTIVLLSSSYSWSADSYRVNASSSQNITAFSVCKSITNNSTKDIFVPAKTSGEWNAFLANLPSNVTATNCTVTAPTSMSLLAGARACGCDSVDKFDGLQVGDLMIILAYRMGPLSSDPAGWTILDDNYSVASGYYSKKWYRFATTADVSSGIGHFVYVNQAEAVMQVVFRGVDTSAPFAAHQVAIGNGTTMTYPTLITTKSNTLLFATAEGAGVSTLPTGATTGSFTDIWNSSTYGTRLSYKVLASPGSTGTVTGTQPSMPWAASLIAINGQ